MRLSTIDRKILNCIQNDIPICQEPFKVLSRQVGIKEEKFIKELARLKDSGIIRNFAARLNHKKLGSISTLIALRIPEEDIESTAKKIIKYQEVTHCYQREGEFNLWTVFICYKKEKQKAFIKRLTKEVGTGNIMNLSTKRQFKLKTKFDL